jgi:GGDEF domain-containing protein
MPQYIFTDAPEEEKPVFNFTDKPVSEKAQPEESGLSDQKDRTVPTAMDKQVESQVQSPKPQKPDYLSLESPMQPLPPKGQYGKAFIEGGKDVIRNELSFLNAANEARARYIEESGNPDLAQKVRDEGKKDALIKTLDAKWLEPDGSYKKSEGLTGYLEDVVGMMPQIGMQIATSVAGGPILGGTVMATQIAGGDENQLKQEGLDPERRWKAALGNAFAQAPLEQIGIGKALKVWKPGKAAVKAIKAMAESGGTEFLTETVQQWPDFMSKIFARGKGKSVEEMLDEFTKGWWNATKEGMYQGAVAAPFGMVTGGAGGVATKPLAGPEIKTEKTGTISPEGLEAPEIKTVGKDERIEMIRQAAKAGQVSTGQLQELYNSAPEGIKQQIGDIINEIPQPAQQGGLFPQQSAEEQAQIEKDILTQRKVKQDPLQQFRENMQKRIAVSRSDKEQALANFREKMRMRQAAEQRQGVIDKTNIEAENEIERNRIAREQLKQEAEQRRQDAEKIREGTQERSGRISQEGQVAPQEGRIVGESEGPVRIREPEDAGIPQQEIDQAAIIEKEAAPTRKMDQAAETAIPEFKDTNEAVAFGEKATPEQLAEIKRLEDQAKAKESEFMAADDFSANRTKNVYKIQLYREALEGSRGEHPSQLDKRTPEQMLGIKEQRQIPTGREIASDRRQQPVDMGGAVEIKQAPPVAEGIPQPERRAGTERRQDTKTRKRWDEMTDEERRKEFFTDELTGLPNHRAYQEADEKPYKFIADVDSLKWVNDNIGHDAGDKLIKRVADAFMQSGAEIYRAGRTSDEYPGYGVDKKSIDNAMEKAYDYLNNNPITVETPDGKIQKFIAGFSYGTGTSQKEADQSLNTRKQEREASGKRAARGERPPGFLGASAEGKQVDNQRGSGQSQKLEQQEPAKFKQGDQVQYGRAKFVFEESEGDRAIISNDKGEQVVDVSEISPWEPKKRTKSYKKKERITLSNVKLLKTLKDKTGSSELANDILRHAADTIQSGTNNYKSFVKSMKSRFYNVWDKIKIHIINIWNILKNQRGQIGQWYYSLLNDYIDLKLPSSGTSQQIKTTIESWAKKNLINQEELEWSGLLEWLGKQKGKVSKQQVLDYLAENNVQVQEVEKSQDKNAMNEFGDIYDSTKFSRYQLPGGENYKELLLIKPQQNISFEQWNKNRASWNKEPGSIEEYNRLKKGNQLLESSGYKSSHWDEQNVLAHIRFNERTDADGNRVLFIEEVQSDWHQAGRKRGYKSEFNREEEIERLKSLGWHVDKESAASYKGYRTYTNQSSSPASSIDEAWDNIINDNRNEAHKGTGVEDAPFKKTWPILAMKRMVRYAAENGFDKIAWTPGDVQAERYDLSKQVDSIQYAKYDESRLDLYYIKDGGQTKFGRYTLDQLPGIVGKDLAKKIEADFNVGKVNEEYSGIDLKVGGEGMKGFYDKILPAEVNKFFNKAAWGNAKVSMSEIGLEKKAWSLSITPEMKQKALSEGMPLFGSSAKRIFNTLKNETGSSEIANDVLRYASDLIIEKKTNYKDFTKSMRKRFANVWSKISKYMLRIWNSVKGVVGNQRGEIKIGKESDFDKLLDKLVKQSSEYGSPGRPSDQEITDKNGGRYKILEALEGPVDEFVYWVVDKNQPMASIQKKLDNVSDGIDLFLKETQRPKRTAARVKKVWDEDIRPFMEAVAKSGLNLADVEEYAHAKHAPEANQALTYANSKRYYNDLVKKLKGKDKKAAQDAGLDSLTPKEWNTTLNEAFKKYKNVEGVKDLKTKWDSFTEKPSGMTNKQADDIINKYKDNKKIENLRKMLSSINDAKLDVLHDAGIITDEEYKSIKEKYEYYVPLYREGYDDFVSGSGRGLKPSGRPIKVRGGSTKKVVNIVGNSVANYEKAINLAEKARSTKALKELVEANPDPDFWSLINVHKSPHYDSSGNLRTYPDMFSVSDNEFRFMSDGKQYMLEVNKDNKNAMLMLKTLKAEPSMTGPILNQFAKVNRFLARVNTSWSPEFILSNFIRDLQTAGINIKSTNVKAKAMLSGAIKSGRAIFRVERGKQRGDALEKMYELFKEAGGKIGWADVHGSVENLSKKITKEIEAMSGKRPVRKTLNQWLDLIENTNTSIENGVRLHAFKLAVDQGISDERAAQIASDLTVDFTKRGAAGPIINSLYLFANAGIQGSYRILRATKSKSVRRMMAGVFGAGFVVGLANSMAGDDEDGEDYFNKIDDFIRERNAIFMVPGTKGGYAKIPLPWGYNFLWNLGTETSRIFTKKNYSPLNGAARMTSTFFNAFNPIASGTLLQTLAPTVADPFVQVAENKNWFGGPLMPEENIFDNVPTPDSQRYWKSARTPSIWVSKTLNDLTGGDKIKPGLIDVSPETLDLVIDNIGGSALRFFSDTLNAPIKLIKKEELQFHEIPFWRRVAGQKSEYSDQEKYFDNIERVMMAKDRLDAYKGTDYYQSILKQTEKELKFIGMAKASESALRKLRKYKKRLEANGRKKMADKIKDRMDDIYIRFNKEFNK